MTSKSLLVVPIIFLLLTHQVHGPSFLHALLAVLHKKQVEDSEFDVILVHEADSSSWGKFVYNDPDDHPADERRWFDLLIAHTDDAVHFWRQFALNKLCLVSDLQKLSNVTKASTAQTAPLLLFKNSYPVLYECLHAVFGLMMSNSRLCEQIHGMMRHGLRKGTGQDKSDAQRSYATSIAYEMRQQRRDNVSKLKSDDRPKKRFKSTKHNKTKCQVHMNSEQIL